MNNGENKRSQIGNVILFAICGMFTALLALLFAFAISVSVANEVLPEEFLGFAGLFGVAIASFATGFISAKVCGRALLTSLIQGIISSCVLYFAGLIVFMRILPQDIDTGIVLSCIVGAVLGGFFAAMFSPRRCKIKK